MTERQPSRGAEAEVLRGVVKRKPTALESAFSGISPISLEGQLVKAVLAIHRAPDEEHRHSAIKEMNGLIARADRDSVARVIGQFDTAQNTMTPPEFREGVENLNTEMERQIADFRKAQERAEAKKKQTPTQRILGYRDRV